VFRSCRPSSGIYKIQVTLKLKNKIPIYIYIYVYIYSVCDLVYIIISSQNLLLELRSFTPMSLMTGLLAYDAASMDFETSSESTVPVPHETMRM